MTEENTPNTPGFEESMLKSIGGLGTVLGVCSFCYTLADGGPHEVADFWPLVPLSMLAVGYLMEIARKTSVSD